jgi:23S rRNA pseudouridine1911/1915/1917 synthase
MLDILFEDAHFLAVNKPAGLLTQGRRAGDPTLEAAVRQHLAPEDPEGVYLGTVHRLDRPVSGVVIWAKNVRAARRIAEQFASRETIKEYRAIVSGEPDPARGVWQDWLYEGDTGLGVVQICLPGAPRARRAVTRFEREDHGSSSDGLSRLILWPETGRTHQLRVQAGSRGFPILGDAAYGSRVGFPEGIALHARRLTIRHPIEERPVTFEAPFPTSWEGFRRP